MIQVTSNNDLITGLDEVGNAFPIEKMAAHAAKILIAKFDGLAEQTKSKEFKSELIMRESLKTL